MSDPNTMPGAMMQEEKKASQLFIEQYKEQTQEEILADKVNARAFYRDTTDALKLRSYGYFTREEEQEKEVAPVSRIIQLGRLPELKMTYKQRKRKDRLSYKLGKRRYDEQKAVEEYYLSSKGMYDPTAPYATVEKTDATKNAPEQETIDKVLNTVYDIDKLFNLGTFSDNYLAVSEVMKEMKSVIEYCRPGTEYYEKASLEEKTKIRFSETLFQKMNECFVELLSILNVKFQKGKLVRDDSESGSAKKLEELKEGAAQFVKYGADSDMQAREMVMEDIIKTRKEALKKENEKSEEIGQKTQFGFLGYETEEKENKDKERPIIIRYLELLDDKNFKGIISQNKDIISDMLSRYINNRKALYESQMELLAVDEEIESLTDKMGEEIDEEKRKQLDIYVNVLEKKKSILINTNRAYSFVILNLNHILNGVMTNQPITYETSKKYLMEAGYMKETKEKLEKEVKNAKLYMESDRPYEQALQDTIRRRYPNNPEEQNKLYNWFKSECDVFWLRPEVDFWDRSHNEDVINLAVHKYNYRIGEMDLQMARMSGVVLPGLEEGQKNTKEAITTLTERLVSSVVDKIMRPDCMKNFSILGPDSLIEMYPEVLSLLREIEAVQKFFNEQTGEPGCSMIDKALKKPAQDLNSTDPGKYQSQMDKYQENRVEFFTRINKIKGLAYMGRSVSLNTEGAKYDMLDTKLSKTEQQWAIQTIRERTGDTGPITAEKILDTFSWLVFDIGVELFYRPIVLEQNSAS